MPRPSEPVASSDSEPAAPKTRSGVWGRRLRLSLLGLSFVFGLFLAFCYARRPDACAAVTVWPVWSWVAPGLLPAALACIGASRKAKGEREQNDAAKPKRGRARPLKLAALFWLLFVLIFAEEPKSLLRWNSGVAGWEAARREGKAIRVVSINCAWGQKAAALEAAPFQPDIVLLQESPRRKDAEEVARKLFGGEGEVVVGLDAAIIVRGKILPAKLPPRVGFFAQARIRLTAGPEIEVVSLHTIVPPVHTDLWNPAVWRIYRNHREDQRNQMRIVARQLAEMPSSVPMIVGGDFNAPQGDAVFRLLQPRLRDTFPEAGTGWGNTIINDMPALRIDQIWVSEHFRPVRVFAQKTLHSDHRMVVCDLFLK
jgi:hypothetical protein